MTGPPLEESRPEPDAGCGAEVVTNDDGAVRECYESERKRQADKADSTLIAEFALAGVELVKLADGTWLAQRWGMFKGLGTSDDARAWLARVAGAQATPAGLRA